MLVWFVLVVSESEADIPDGMQEIPILHILAGSWHCVLQGMCTF